MEHIVLTIVQTGRELSLERASGGDPPGVASGAIWGLKRVSWYLSPFVISLFGLLIVVLTWRERDQSDPENFDRDGVGTLFHKNFCPHRIWFFLTYGGVRRKKEVRRATRGHGATSAWISRQACQLALLAPQWPFVYVLLHV